MTMRKKIFIVIYSLVILSILGVLYFIVSSIDKAAMVALTPRELADTTITQYKERPYANNTTHIQPPPTILNGFLSSIKEGPLVEGCSLRFSFTPQAKVIEPQGTIYYNITLSNQGKEKCSNVSFSVYYPNNETYLTSTPRPTASDYYWAIGDLDSNEKYTVNVTTQSSAENGNEVLSEACATGDNSQDICSNNVIFARTGASIISKIPLTMPKKSTTDVIWGESFQSKEFGVWVWDSPSSITPIYAREIISAAKKNGFNRIYITIDDYLTILNNKNSTEMEAQKNAYMQSLLFFIKGAKSSGIEVDVEGGSRNWAYPQNRINGYNLIDFVKEYNQKYPEAKIHGLQYDVEPYLLPEYENNKEKVLTDFIEFIDESAKRMSLVDASFSVVIPHFYDSTQRWTPSIKYNGKMGYTFTQLLTVLEQKKDSTLIIMAYRNFFYDDNGVRQITESEIREAGDNGYTTKIVIAQETGHVSPDYITYYEHPKKELFDTLKNIHATFGTANNFGGTAIHYLDPFLKLSF